MKPQKRINLNVMIRELQKMKTELLQQPEDTIQITTQDGNMIELSAKTKNFEQRKLIVVHKLMTLQQNIQNMNPDKKSVKAIHERNANYKTIREVEVDLQFLQPRAKTPEQKQIIEKLSHNLQILEEKNSGRIMSLQEPQSATEIRIQNRMERRRQRNNRLKEKRRNNKDDNHPKDICIEPELSPQVQSFMQEVKENDKQMDEYLQIISQGLTEIKEIAIDIGSNLDVQNQKLDEMDGFMAATTSKMMTVNKRVKLLLLNNGCHPGMVCLVVFLFICVVALLGYIFSIF